MKRPERVTLEGQHVKIVPLDAAAHERALYEGSCGLEREPLWRYMSNGPYTSEAEFHAVAGGRGEIGRSAVLHHSGPRFRRADGVLLAATNRSGKSSD